MAAAVLGDAGAVAELRCVCAKVRSKPLAGVKAPLACSGLCLWVSMPRKATQQVGRFPHALDLQRSCYMTAAARSS